MVSVALDCWVPILLSATKSLLSDDWQYYSRAPKIPWTRWMPEISNEGEVSSLGTSFCLAP